MYKLRWIYPFLVSVISIVGLTTAHAQLPVPPVQGPTGNIYQVFWEPGVTWEQAQRLAQQQIVGGIRGHLVTLRSRVEDLFVKDLLESLGVSFIPEMWIGGYHLPSSSTVCDGWVWVNDEGPIPVSNETPDYANWPQPLNNPGDCSFMGVNYPIYIMVGNFGDPRRYSWFHQTHPHNIWGFVVEYETGDGRLLDCNQNGVHDAIDVVTGTSLDENGDGIPDECSISFRLVEESQQCVLLTATTLIPMRGGEVGIAYDPDVRDSHLP